MVVLTVHRTVILTLTVMIHKLTFAALSFCLWLYHCVVHSEYMYVKHNYNHRLISNGNIFPMVTRKKWEEKQYKIKKKRNTNELNKNNNDNKESEYNNNKKEKFKQKTTEYKNRTTTTKIRNVHQVTQKIGLNTTRNGKRQMANNMKMLGKDFGKRKYKK